MLQTLRRSFFLVLGFAWAGIAAGCNPAGSTGIIVAPPTPTAIILPTAMSAPTGAPAAALVVAVRDRLGREVERTVDGNALQVEVRLDRPAPSAVQIDLRLAGKTTPAASCSIPVGESVCTAALRADGWAWENRRPVGVRTLVATASGGAAVSAERTVAVTPKPIVLVHGLNSNHTSWINWVTAGGYLEAAGTVGYAVDDGQFGTRAMNTGDPAKPFEGTLSIAENAAIMHEYVEAVRANTGAERVDLVGHSLGGLISRYYVQNLMPVVDAPGLPPAPVANQLFMAGTPNGGTPCGRPAAALGVFSPATTQITPEYLAQVFNPAVNDRRGVPFFAIAGDAVQEKLAIRCTEIPTDRYVSVRSVLRGVSVSPDQISGVHSDLNNRRDSFERIFPSLARSPEDYPIRMQPATEPVAAPEQVQSTLVQGGTLRAGETVSVTLTIDQARSASFILLAPGSVVSMTIKTVAGAILTEATPSTNPNVTFERVLDSAIPLSLGYGVLNPRAGAWEIGLTARETPPGGGPFAVLATMETDLAMTAEARPGAVRSGQPVGLRAALVAPAPLQGAAVRALVREDRGTAGVVSVQLFDDGAHADDAAGDGTHGAVWTPARTGSYTVVISATGRDGAGNPFERLSVLGVEVTP